MGLSLGVIGSGGSILIVPILVYVAHVPANEPVGMSLAIVCATSIVGSAVQFWRGAIAVNTVAPFAASGIVGAYLGSQATHLVSQRSLMLAFAALMVVAAARMWFTTAPTAGTSPVSLLQRLVAGFAVGLVSGFLIVPALILFAGLENRTATASSLAIIALNSAGGVAGQLRYVHFNAALLTGAILSAVAGLAFGLRLARNLPEMRVRRIFAVTVLLLAIVVGGSNL